MKKIIIAIVIAILIITGVLYIGTKKTSLENAFMRTTTPKQVVKPVDKNAPAVDIVATNLQIPWALVFIPDTDDMLVTQRTGNLIRVSKDGEKQTVATLPIKTVGEGGLLGMTLDPNFSENHYIYFYYTYSSNGSNVLNRVVRYKFEDNKITGEKILVDKIPGNSNHDGGRIKFGPDGNLYITTGDAEDPSHAQDKNSLAGKILRIAPDGKPAADNPFNNTQGTSSLVYSYGHRNPQGLAWDDSGKLWSTEHGRSAPTGYDELNIIEPGKNYGWDIIQGDETKNGMVTPIINSGSSNTWAPAGAIFLSGKIYFAGLRGTALYEYDIASKNLTEHLKNQYGRLRDVEIGPDGFIYVTTSNGDGRGNPAADDDKILKINPEKLSTL